MKLNAEIHRMGKGHALTVTLDFKIRPDELPKILSDTDYRQAFCNEIAEAAHMRIANHAPTILKKVKP